MFLYSFEADLIQELLKKNQQKLAQSFNSMVKYIDGFISLYNSTFGGYGDRINLTEFEVNNTTYTYTSAS